MFASHARKLYGPAFTPNGYDRDSYIGNWAYRISEDIGPDAYPHGSGSPHLERGVMENAQRFLRGETYLQLRERNAQLNGPASTPPPRSEYFSQLPRLFPSTGNS
jgi:hypothetical protein